MRLQQHDDFAAFVTAAAAESELSEPFVEKDYWITEILRTVADTLGDRAIFKGGTSLSKGWNLIDRFSEDVDLFVNPAVEPTLASPRAIDKVLKQLNQDVASIPGLDFIRDDSRTFGGFGRDDVFRYESRYSDVPDFPPTVLLEAGIQSGDQPIEEIAIFSIVGRMLAERGVVGELGVDGLQPFPMTLLHFRRTFVEKLFAIHGKIERLKQDGHPIGRDARHYADLYVLAGEAEVLAMLASPEYGEIKADYDETSRKYFPKSYRPPDGLRFDSSDALFPPDDLRAVIEPTYEEECRRLFFRPHPPFSEVLGRLATIRDVV
jgi:hypothetical protein